MKMLDAPRTCEPDGGRRLVNPAYTPLMKLRFIP